MNESPPLGRMLRSFFEDYLQCQKGLQPTTLSSYRDAVLLFLRFVAADSRRKMTRLQLADLTSDRVLRFLAYLEKDRGNSVATRNHRLIALRSLYEYAATRDPMVLLDAQRVANIPTKRTSPPRMRFLHRDEIETLFTSISSPNACSLRDQALLLFLYNTGARVQEAAKLRVGDLDLGDKPRAHLHGKGDKWRTCPLWKNTADMLIDWLGSRIRMTDASVFTSRTGSTLTRFGIYKIVRRLVAHSGLDRDGLSPHTFRHTTAVHLLESGVEVNVIRAWLGHVSLETTNRYAEITTQMKAQALQTCEPPVSPDEDRRNTKWRDDDELLKWLRSL